MAPPLPRAVKALGLVSLLTDASSEMIYPLLPLFLTSVLKAGPAFLGLVEGVAEATASFVKLAAGYWSDRASRRKPLVVAGYTVSSLVRPLVGLAQAPWHVLAVRFTDRIGKGVRGAPRDALIAEVTSAETRGRAYGFHRAMDHAGAVVGPLLASWLLARGLSLRETFLWSAVPALLSIVALVFGVGEPHRSVRAAPAHVEAGRRTHLGGDFARYLGILALFTLGNSSDAFLLLRAQDLGVGAAAVPLLWSFHHVVKSALSTRGGALSDRLGRRKTIALGWIVYALTYAGFAVATRPAHAWLLFAAYGVFFALTEGAERAIVAELAPTEARGRAFGLFHAVTGGMLLPASLLTGALWEALGAPTALGTGASLAGIAAVLLLTLVPSRGEREPALAKAA